jgi:ABC-type nitrate/sulfonate/bicarbonate transport system substrate-binding protein
MAHPAGRAGRSHSTTGSVVALCSAACLAILSACGSSSSGDATAAPKTLTKVTVVVPSITTTYLALFIGQYDGLYRKAGLDVTIETITSTAMIPALLSNQAQFLGAVGDIFNPFVQQLKIVEASSLWAPDALVSQKGITSIQQLKGTTLAGGGGTYGQPNNYIRAVMTKAGVPAGRYTVANVSSDAGGRFEAVEAGKASATPVDLNYLVAPPVKGYPVLAKGHVFRSMGAGLLTSDALIKSNKSLVSRMVQATAEATKIGDTNEKVAVAAWKKGTAVEHYTYTTAQWDQIWQLEKDIFSTNGRPPAASQTAYQSLIETSQTLPGKPTLSQLFNLSFLPK